MSMPAGIGIGAALSMLIMVIGCGIVAWMLDREVIPSEGIGYAAMIILLLTSFVGAIAAIGLVKRRNLLVCLIQTGTYFALLLLINGMMFGGAVSGVGVTAMILFAGAGCAFLLGTHRGGKKMGKPKRWRTG